MSRGGFDDWLDRALAAAFLLWLFLACCVPLKDTDFWWHLRTGELILARGELPYVDWFTFTSGDRAWIDLHWGFQLLVTLLYRLGGVALVTLVKAAVLTLAVAIAWSVPKRNIPAWLNGLCWIMPIIVISGRAYERPEMLSMLFLASWIWIIARLPSNARLIWLLPPLQLVWTNCHALFVLGLIVGACYAVDFSIRKLARGRCGLYPLPGPPSARTVAIALSLTLLACFVNPYVEHGALFPLELYRKFSSDRELYSSIGEFQRPIDFFLRNVRFKGSVLGGLQNVYFCAEAGLFLATGLSFLWLALVRRRWSPQRLLLFAAFSHLAWQASRNSNIFALVSGIILSVNAGDIIAGFAPISLRTRRWMTAVVCALAAALSLSVVTGAWEVWTKEDKRFRLGEAEAWFAHDASRFAAQPGFPDRAFVAHIGQAAVYLYHNGPDRRVFMDPRLEVASPDTFRKFNNICNMMAAGDRSWESALRNADGELPVIILDSLFSRLQIRGLAMTPGWRLVYADPVAAVFLEEKTANRLGLREADPEPLLSLPRRK